MPSARIEFTGSLGHPLAGRLDTPDGAPRAWAVFAHCFTCSKDSKAAAYIARALAEAAGEFDAGTGHGDPFPSTR